MPSSVASGSAASSWSAASTSTFSVMFSIGAPASRNASLVAGPVPAPLVAVLACSVRVISSGLYWNATAPSGPVASTATSAPRVVFGDCVSPVIA